MALVQVHELSALGRTPADTDVMLIDTGTTTNKLTFGAVKSAATSDVSGAVTQLESDVGDLQTALSAETTARQNGDAALLEAIDTICPEIDLTPKPAQAMGDAMGMTPKAMALNVWPSTAWTSPALYAELSLTQNVFYNFSYDSAVGSYTVYVEAVVREAGTSGNVHLAVYKSDEIGTVETDIAVNGPGEYTGFVTLSTAFNMVGLSLAGITYGAGKLPVIVRVAVLPSALDAAGIASYKITNPQVISGFTGANVQHCGKNLLGAFASAESTSGGVTFTYSNGNHIKMTATSTTGANNDSPSKPLYDLDQSTARPIWCPAGQPVTISIKNSTTATTSYDVVMLVRNTSGTSMYSPTSRNLVWTFTPREGFWFGRLTIRIKTANHAVDIEGDIQIEFEDAATAYEAPVANRDVAVSWSADAGTVCFGTLDMLTGTLTATHKMVMANTISNWARYTANSSAFGAKISDMKQGVVNVFSNAFTTKNEELNAMTNGSMRGSNDSNQRVYIKDDTCANLTAWNAKTETIQILYELATPATYDLSLDDVVLYAGSNSVWTDCGDVTLDYRANPYTRLYNMIINP